MISVFDLDSQVALGLPVGIKKVTCPPLSYTAFHWGTGKANSVLIFRS